MAQEKMYKAALEAIDQGQNARARDLFTRLLRTDSSKAEYWLWMSTLVDSNQERIYCLESALRADPDSEAAKRGLIILGAREPGKDVTPVPPIRRNWEKELVNVTEPPKSLLHRIWNNRILRFGSVIVAGLIVVGLILTTVNGVRQRPEEPVVVYKVSPFPTRTTEPSLTPAPTRTFAVRSPTPTYIGATPLSIFLPETYTPAPIYVDTPHPVTEAYRAGLTAYGNSDWSALLGFMQQAATAEPESPDIYYYMAEAYRKMGRYQDAVVAYEQALELNPQFAPAYLGRALAYEKINPKADIEGDVTYAIEYDPNYVDAYLNRARVRIKHNNPTGAMEDLLTVDSLYPNNPMVYVLLAQAYLKLNDPTNALQNAQIGYELDKTSLPAYLTLAKVYLARNDSIDAIKYIETYLAYTKDDADGWAIKTQAEYQIGNFDEALGASELGLALDEENAPSWYYRGLIHTDRGDTRTAVNELVNAVKFDPENFPYNIALGKALWADDRLSQATRQFDGAELLALNDRQLSEVYYDRARVYDQMNKLTLAQQDWELLLALPTDQVPVYWRKYAQERLSIINPSTPEETPAATLTQSEINTQTPTPQMTLTPTPFEIP
jgi:tetratricopeptide (TPR) repeat protein